MPRQPRNALPGQGIYHVTSRGVDRCWIVRDDIDRKKLFNLMVTCGGDAGWRCHAFVIMDNHFHAIVETSLDRLSTGMRRIKARYARHFNDRHARTGHLFQGRFDAWVIRDEEHLAKSCAYVWNNPVRVELCKEAAEWPWSGRF